jgi:iron complex transport system substrate-binding protein
MRAAVAPALRVALAIAIGLAPAASACASRFESSAPAKRDGCITGFNPETDYFPDKSTVAEATNFTVDYHNSYQVLTVKQPYPNGAPASYVLVRCGAPAPVLTGELAQAPQVTVPVQSLYSASTTHLGMITELDKTDVVTGVADTTNVVSPAIRHRIDTGKAIGYAPGQQVNVETVISARPDVLVTQGIDDASYLKLRDAGVDVIADAEWLEATPLGRAEWVKVFAAMTGTEKSAEKVYNTIRHNYHKVVKDSSTAAPADVLTGTMHQGTWSMPTGGDYAGRLIVDAGGTYPWAGGNKTGSLQLNFESVYAKAGHAPLWLVTADWKTLNDAVAQDSRYAELASVRDGQVWSATKATGSGGGNDYWERGVARPDLVLGDLIAILHPDIAPGHRFEFYRELPRR